VQVIYFEGSLVARGGFVVGGGLSVPHRAQTRQNGSGRVEVWTPVAQSRVDKARNVTTQPPYFDYSGSYDMQRYQVVGGWSQF